MSRKDSLALVTDEILSCTDCRLHKNRKNAVPGEGDPDPCIVFIGEAPGRDEDIEGRPFVGRAGKLLDQLLEEVGLSRPEVYITNVVKCRPPDNRDPRADEKSICRGYLDRQIALLGPDIICTLGNHATTSFTGEKGINNLHGKIMEDGDRLIIPLYHPAAGLYNPNLVVRMKEDMEKIVEFLNELKE